MEFLTADVWSRIAEADSYGSWVYDFFAKHLHRNWCMIEEWILILGVWYKSFSNQSHLIPFTGFFPCMPNTATRNQATDAFPRSRWCNCERDRCVYQCPHSGNWTVPGRSYPATKSKACCCGADLFSCGLGWWYTIYT